MNEPVECLRCHTRMEVGYVADVTQRLYQRQKWSPGVPQPSFWGGLKVDRKSLVPVTTLRCPNCGYLESYARGRPVVDN